MAVHRPEKKNEKTKSKKEAGGTGLHARGEMESGRNKGQPHVAKKHSAATRVKEYPSWTCRPCGLKHGVKERQVATWHYGKCDVCKRNAEVTEPRDFGHFPNWFK